MRCQTWRHNSRSCHDSIWGVDAIVHGPLLLHKHSSSTDTQDSGQATVPSVMLVEFTIRLPGCEALTSLKPLRHIWSYLACRIGYWVPIRQPLVGSSFQQWGVLHDSGHPQGWDESRMCV
jgi:hypothetical protein